MGMRRDGDYPSYSRNRLSIKIWEDCWILFHVYLSKWISITIFYEMVPANFSRYQQVHCWINIGPINEMDPMVGIYG